MFILFSSKENISTLNYATLAQRISNVAVINEDPKTRLIRQLRAQVKFLLEQLKHSKQVFVAGNGSNNGTNTKKIFIYFRFTNPD